MWIATSSFVVLALGLVAVCAAHLPAIRRLIGEVDDFDAGRVIGRLVGLLIAAVAFPFAALVVTFFLSRRSSRAANIAFVVVTFLVALAAASARIVDLGGQHIGPR